MELFRPIIGGSDGPTVQDQVATLWLDMAGTPFPHQVPALVAAFGSDRVLYGSDYCWTPAAATTAQIASIDTAPPPEGDSWRDLPPATHNGHCIAAPFRRMDSSGLSHFGPA